MFSSLRLFVFALTVSSSIAATEIAIQSRDNRTCFLTNETISFEVRNPPAHGMTWEVGSSLKGEIAGGDRSPLITIPPHSLRSGKYQLILKSSPGGNVIATEHFFLSAGLSPERLRHLLWPDDRMAQVLADPNPTNVENAIAVFRDLGITDLPVFPTKADPNEIGAVEARYLSLGYTNFKSTPATSMAVVKRNLDLILAAGLASGLRGLPIPAPRDETQRITMENGTKHPFLPNPWDQRNIAEGIESTRALVGAVKSFPAFSTYFVSSEIEWPLDWSNSSRERLKQELGFLPIAPMVPRFSKPGVVSDDDHALRFERYFYERGQGDVARNTALTRVVKEFAPHAIVWSDPLRYNPVPDAFQTGDMVSTWTYTNPDPKYCLSIEHLRAVAKEGNRKVMNVVTLLNYPGTMKPGKMERSVQNNYISMSADRYSICQWINLSRRPDFLGTYFSQTLNPLNEDAAENPFKYNPEVLASMRRFDKDVTIPAGPLFKHLSFTPRKVALINSLAARVHGKVPRGPGYYKAFEINDMAAVLAMAQIPFDEVFDANLSDQALAGYQVIILPKADVISESTFQVLSRFIAHGGTVVVDPFFQAPLENVVRLDWEQTYRKRVNANSLATEASVERNDQGQMIKTVTGAGVTADDDQRKMETFAADLRAKLTGKFDRDLDSDSPRILLSRLTGGGISYVIAVNDHRTYDERVGQWRSILDKGLPESSKLRFKTDLPKPVVYDVLAGKKLPSILKDGWVEIEVTLASAWGAIYAIQPAAFGPLALSVTDGSKTGPKRVKVSLPAGTPSAGVQVVRVDIRDAAGKSTDYCGYYSMVRGERSIEVVPALNEPTGEWRCKVTHLASGQSAEQSFGVFR